MNVFIEQLSTEVLNKFGKCKCAVLLIIIIILSSCLCRNYSLGNDDYYYLLGEGFGYFFVRCSLHFVVFYISPIRTLTRGHD